MFSRSADELFLLAATHWKPATLETWSRWRNATTCELWEAIALLCSLDPTDRGNWRGLRVFEFRLKLALDQLDIIDPLSINSKDERRSIVRLDAIRRLARVHILPIPDGFPQGGAPFFGDDSERDQVKAPVAAVPANAKLANPLEVAAAGLASAAVLVAEPVPKRHRRKTRAVPADFLRIEEVLSSIVPFSKATLWRRVKEGTFPGPVKFSAKVVAWSRASLDEWKAGLVWRDVDRVKQKPRR